MAQGQKRGGDQGTFRRGASPHGNTRHGTRRPAPCRLQLGRALALGLVLLGLPGAAASGAWEETPSLVAAVADGRLPPIADRLPETPALVALDRAGWSPGRPGGALRTLIANPRDVRMMTVYGYARLVRYAEDLTLVPDILREVEVEEDRRFTLHLRPGHRWSDGHPFTTEDFRFFWEDVLQHPQLFPAGPPAELMVEGELPEVEILDAVRVRYSWSRPNPNLLPALASAMPLYLQGPAHYLKPFHADYADPAELEAWVQAAGQRNWAALFTDSARQYRNTNRDLPTLDPWMLVTEGVSTRYVFGRNPYFHRVDTAGRQLPYLDQVIMSVADGKLIPAKAGAGEADLQARSLRFDNYTFLKQAEANHDIVVRLWRSAQGAHLALYPNLTTTDPVWRDALRDARLRRALSLAVDRHELNEVIYFGLAIEGANTVLPESPLYREEYRTRWTGFDVDSANRLLDEMGLTERNSRGLRLLPDGRPMEIVVETAGESSEEADVLALVHDSWLQIGVKLYTRPSQREVFRNRTFSGEPVMTIWGGVENGIPTADMSPAEFVPMDQNQLQWARWGQYYQTHGLAGVPVDLPQAQVLFAYMEDWRTADSAEEREAAWHAILETHADQVFSIGLVAGVYQPVVASTRLRNLPEDGLYNWDPGAHFGIYSPDTFWLDDGDVQAAGPAATRRQVGQRP